MQKYLTIIGAVIVIGVLGTLAWYIVEYNGLKSDNAVLNKNILVANTTIEELQSNLALKETLYKIAETAISDLNEENKKLKQQTDADVIDISSRERPENEKACSIHPAIERSLSLVREQRGSREANRLP